MWRLLIFIIITGTMLGGCASTQYGGYLNTSFTTTSMNISGGGNQYADSTSVSQRGRISMENTTRR